MEVESKLHIERELTHRELATILAALRVFQEISQSGTRSYSKRELDEMEHFEEGIRPLTPEEIDKLCESIHLTPLKPMTTKECGNQHGLLCPSCDTGTDLAIAVSRWATLRPDGAEDEPADTEWDTGSAAKCISCSWEGKVGDLNKVELTDQ